MCNTYKTFIFIIQDGDGKLELAMGYSDRVIRLYKWIGPAIFDSDTESPGSMIQIDKWQLAGQVKESEVSISLSADQYS